MSNTLSVVLTIVFFILLGAAYLFIGDKGPSVVVTAPSAGESWTVGSTHTIEWTTKNIPPEHMISVTLRRVPPPPLQEEGQEFDPIVFVNLPNTGSVEWTIASQYPSGTYVLGVNSYASVPIINPVVGESSEFTITNADLLGGDRDEYGCIGSAGYSWCEAKQVCIRTWEEYCTAAAPKKVLFNCDESKSITATFYVTDDKFVDLELSDDRKLSVPRAISASGARYATADETFVFWNKGDTAFITEGAEGVETFKNCVLDAE
jgi:membrane-bound inhibitor of C-type lysozyme